MADPRGESVFSCCHGKAGNAPLPSCCRTIDGHTAFSKERVSVFSSVSEKDGQAVKDKKHELIRLILCNTRN